jgi:hypothetical protein
MATTITEALQELKTIQKRLEVKRQSLMQYIARDARVKDPLEREGGSVEFIRRERQAIGDLEQRVVNIRTAIQRANLSTSLTLNGTGRTVAEWLTWRREVSAGTKNFLTSMVNGIRNTRGELQKKGLKLVESDNSAAPGDVVVHVDEKALLEQQENMEQLLGDLDGKLSLLNATTVIDV